MVFFSYLLCSIFIILGLSYCFEDFHHYYPELALLSISKKQLYCKRNLQLHMIMALFFLISGVGITAKTIRSTTMISVYLLLYVCFCFVKTYYKYTFSK